MKFRVTDEQAWARPFTALSPADLADGIRRAWDDRIAASPLSRPEVAGSVAGVHPALAFRARMSWVDRWLSARMARATPQSDVRSWRAQADLWRYEARVELGVDEWLSPLRLHVHTQGDVWAAPCQRVASGWACSPNAPRVARVVGPEVALTLYEGAEAIVEHGRNVEALVGHVEEAVRRELYPAPRLVPR